jgi:hypothetical protein
LSDAVVEFILIFCLNFLIDFSKDKRVDLIGIPAPTGEYRLLARSNRDPLGSMALSFGTGTDGQFNVLAPSGSLTNAPPLQVATWQDGSKIIIRSLQAMQIKMETSNTTTSAIPPGYEAASKFHTAPSSRR